MSQSTIHTGAPGEWLTTEARSQVTRKSTAKAWAILSGHVAFYLLTVAGAIAPLPLAVNIVFAILNGFAIGLLFAIGHDCVHKAFAPDRLTNQIMARISFLPCAHSASQWEVVHNKNHHGNTNLKGVDYVWAPMSKAEFDAASPLRRRMERLYRNIGGSGIYYLIDFWLRRLIAPVTAEMRAQWRRHLPDSIFVITTLALTIVLIMMIGKAWNPERSYLTIFLVGWAAPYLLWNYLVGISVYLQHTHPEIHWSDDPQEWTFYNGAIAGTTHVEIPFKWAWLFFDGMAHTAHHALPSIPIYNIKSAQDVLMERYGDQVVRYKFTIENYRRTLAACKLYDFDRHCWTDFDGTPTGPQRQPPAIASAS